MSNLEKIHETISLSVVAEKTKEKKNDDVLASLSVDTPVQSARIAKSQLTQTERTVPLLNLSIYQISMFEGNPRRYKDSESYEILKNSIRAIGIQQPVHVTKRPDDQKFVLSNGGNSRLAILRELHTETDDPKFSTIPCVFEDFKSNKKIFFGHAVENELRINMYIWDKAYTCANAREYIESETNKLLSLSELRDKFSAEGYEISKANIRKHLFAIDNLSCLGDKYVYSLSALLIADFSKIHTTYKNKIDPTIFQKEWEQIITEWANENNNLPLLDLSELIKVLTNRLKLKFPSVQIDEKPVVKPQVAQQNDDEDTHKAVNEQSQFASEDENDSQQGISATQLNNDSPAIPIYDEGQLTSKIAIESQKLLELVGLKTLLVKHPVFKLGFYIEYPDFDTLLSDPKFKDHVESDGIKPFLIDYIHPEARDILYFLVTITEQDLIELDQLSQELNPESVYLKTKLDPDIEQQNQLKWIGDTPYGFMAILSWATDSEL